MTRSLGFCPLYLPERGPEKEKHWKRFTKVFCVNQGLGWGTILNAQVDLDEDATSAILDILTGLRVRHLPESTTQRELLANIIGGAFNEDVKDAMVARLLQWNTPRCFFDRDENLSRSFGLLKNIVHSLGSERAWFTDEGITIIGTSGRVYVITQLVAAHSTESPFQNYGHQCVSTYSCRRRSRLATSWLDWSWGCSTMKRQPRLSPF
jgi:hypothetical protein